MVAFVQEGIALGQGDTNAGVSSVSLTFPAAVTAGNVVLLVIRWNGGATITGVSGVGGTSSLIASTNTGTSNLSAYKIVGVTGGTTITMSFGATLFSLADLHAIEIAAAGTITANATNTASTSSVSGDSDSLSTGDLAYEWLQWTVNAAGTNADTPAAWSALTGGWSTSLWFVNPAYLIASSSETAQHAVTIGSTASLVMQASVKVAALPVARRKSVTVIGQSVTRAAVI